MTRCLKFWMVSRVAAISWTNSWLLMPLSAWMTIWVLPTLAFGPRSRWSWALAPPTGEFMRMRARSSDAPCKERGSNTLHHRILNDSCHSKRSEESPPSRSARRLVRCSQFNNWQGIPCDLARVPLRKRRGRATTRVTPKWIPACRGMMGFCRLLKPSHNSVIPAKAGIWEACC